MYFPARANFRAYDNHPSALPADRPLAASDCANVGMLSVYLAASPTATAIRASLAIFVVIVVVLYMIWRCRRGQAESCI